MDWHADVPNPIQVLHIKTRRREFELLRSCPSVTYENLEVGALDPGTRRLERYLGRFPDLYRYRNDVDLENRCLFECNVSTYDPNSSGEYYVYKWIEPGGRRLPENQYFHYTNAYGPAFFFRRDQNRRRDRQGMAKFDPMIHIAHSLDSLRAVDTLTEDMLEKAELRENILRGLLEC